MAIQEMSEFSLFVFKEHREELLRVLQSFSYVHFRDLRPLSEEHGLKELPTDAKVQAVEEKLTKLDWMMKLVYWRLWHVSLHL